MLVLHEQYIGLTVASVQSGLPCGKTTGVIIDPTSLSVALLVIQDRATNYYLRPEDVRFVTPQRVIIDAEEKLSEGEDLLRYQDLLTQNFQPIGCTVETEDRKKLGKVGRYALDDMSWTVEKLYVVSGILANPLSQEHIISRADILTIDSKKIIVRSLASKVRKPLTIPLPKNAA